MTLNERGELRLIANLLREVVQLHAEPVKEWEEALDPPRSEMLFNQAQDQLDDLIDTATISQV